MVAFSLRTGALALTAAIGLSACTTPFGYNGLSVGIGNGGYYDPYYGGYGYGAGYPGYGYGYGAGYPGYGLGYAPYWGWYDDFYYPGTGFYVYDAYRRPFRWTDTQRIYWTGLRQRALSTSTTSKPVTIQENWTDFDRSRARTRTDRRIERQTRVERSQPMRVERSQPVRVERSRPVRVERGATQVETNKSTVRAERTRPTRIERSSERTERQAARAERRQESQSTQTDRRPRGGNPEQ